MGKTGLFCDFWVDYVVYSKNIFRWRKNHYSRIRGRYSHVMTQERASLEWEEMAILIKETQIKERKLKILETQILHH